MMRNAHGWGRGHLHYSSCYVVRRYYTIYLLLLLVGSSPLAVTQRDPKGAPTSYSQ